MTGAVTMSNQSQIRLGELTTNGANYVALQSPALVGANVTFTLPGADGAANQTLATNGSGTLSWINSPLSLQNYRVQAYVGSNFNFSLGGTNTVPYSTKVSDPNSNFNATTYTYTAPVTGIYIVNASVTVSASLAVTRRLQLVKNGSNLTGCSTSSTLVGGALLVSCIIPLNASDTLQANLTGGLGDIILSGDSALFIYCISA